jgi:radical SAM superfamily enzyme YgiQ (UPF0313 family)
LSKPVLKEHNAIIKDLRSVDVLVGYCYPSTYRAGMTGLATHLFYGILNGRDDTSCERYFRYDTASSVKSVETGRPLSENHIVAFSLTWEEDILNLVQMLEKSKIGVMTNQRGEDSPLVIAGGPVVSANPEPYVDFIDAFAIGEGDSVIHDIVDAVKEASSRTECLSILENIPGIYVPSSEPSSVERIIMPELDSLFHPIAQIIPEVPDGSKLDPVFGKALLIEVTRGCGHSCKFCLVGHICRPRRVRSIGILKKIVESGLTKTPVRKVALIGSSLGDLDNLEDFAQWVVNQDLELSAPSLRADTVSEKLLDALVKGGQRTLTIAPEAGSPELRRSMGKGLDDSEIDDAITLAAKSGYKAVKLYFIVGLPGETDDDVSAIAKMTSRLAASSGLRVTASVNPFVPKAHTRWQREGQIPLDEMRRRLKLIEKELHNKPRVVLEGSDPRSARVQAALSLGDRSLGSVIRQASLQGGFGGWRRAERETGVPFFSIASDTARLQDHLPWSFISS